MYTKVKKQLETKTNWPCKYLELSKTLYNDSNMAQYLKPVKTIVVFAQIVLDVL